MIVEDVTYQTEGTQEVFYLCYSKIYREHTCSTFLGRGVTLGVYDI